MMPNGSADAPGRKIKEIKDLGKARDKANPKVRELSVKDLRDLESKFQGRDPKNSRVDALEIDDLNNLEEVFRDYKNAAFQRARAEGLPGVPTAEDPEDWTVSCCSCTPCCCCAAAEVDPFASSATEQRSA